MKRMISLSLLLFTAVILHASPADSTKKADTSYWKTGGVFGLNFTQVALSNWAAGGQSSVSGTALLNLFANYKRKNMQWDNVLDLGYGMINQGNQNLWVKSDDKIEFSSKFGRKAFDHWFYTTMLGFRSQFATGFDDPYKPDSTRKIISDFLAPAYVMLSLGLDYKPNDHFNLLLSPITSKTTIVNNQTLADAGAFGVTKASLDVAGLPIPGTGKRIRYEIGGYMKCFFKTEIMKNVNLIAKLELFSNYLKKPENIDVNSELLIAMKVNKFLTVTINMLCLYDDDINIARDTNGDGINDKSGPITQFKEVLGIGFSFKF